MENPGHRGRATDISKGLPGQGSPAELPSGGMPGASSDEYGMQVHFLHRHVLDTVVILEEGNLPHPRCTRCDMMVP